MVVDPEKAKALFLESGLKPLTEYPGSGKPWKSKHNKCGNVVSPTYNFIKAGGKGCIHCAGLAPITEKQAIKLFKVHGFQPLVKFPGAKKPWKVKHNVCGRTVSPTYGSVRSGSGCKYCQVGGINLKAPGFIYLITNPKLKSHKVGIGGIETNVNRLDQHKRHGWVIYRQMAFKTADDAYELEQKILDWLRHDLNLSQHLLPSQMPQGGHTETVDAREIELSTIWEKVEQLSKVKK
jgi:hypothetical protein